MDVNFISRWWNALIGTALTSGEKTDARADIGAAPDTVIEDYEDGGAKTAGAITHDCRTGKVLSIASLDTNTTMELTNIAERETVVVYMRQTTATGDTFAFTSTGDGYTIKGLTTAIADVPLGEWGVAMATRVGSTLIVSAQAVPE